VIVAFLATAFFQARRVQIFFQPSDVYAHCAYEKSAACGRVAYFCLFLDVSFINRLSFASIHGAGNILSIQCRPRLNGCRLFE